jgi:hypothetical protein
MVDSVCVCGRFRVCANGVACAQVLMQPPQRRRSVCRSEAEDKRVRAPRFAVGDKVETPVSEFLVSGKENVWAACKVVNCNDDGSYDLEYLNEWAWLGTVTNIPHAQVQAKIDKKAMAGEKIWRWEGQSESEDEAWRSDDTDGDENVAMAEPVTSHSISFAQLHQLREALTEELWHEASFSTALTTIAADGKRFAEISQLAACLKERGMQVQPPDKHDSRMLLLNLLYSPRRSRLHSLARALTRIENLSYICPWTRDLKLQGGDGVASSPTIDLVELPRLKLVSEF